MTRLSRFTCIHCRLRISPWRIPVSNASIIAGQRCGLRESSQALNSFSCSPSLAFDLPEDSRVGVEPYAPGFRKRNAPLATRGFDDVAEMVQCFVDGIGRDPFQTFISVGGDMSAGKR